jgi:hypothetical protein
MRRATRLEGDSGVRIHFKSWIARYMEIHRDEIAADAEFARWLEEEYVPLAGGWHY